MTSEKLNTRRRQILTAITGALAAIFAGLAANPVFGSMNESARTKNEGAPVEIDISDEWHLLKLPGVSVFPDGLYFDMPWPSE